MMYTRGGFTLVELLTIIGIIGILSTGSLIAIRGVRENARLNSAKHFAQTVHHSLGAYLVSEWRFDEPLSGGKTFDSSGSDYTLTEIGSSQYISECIINSCFRLNAGDYLQATGGDPTPKLDFGLDQNFTVSAWIQANAGQTSALNYLIIGQGTAMSGWVMLMDRGDDLNLAIEGQFIWPVNVNATEYDIDDEKWHHVVISVNRDKGEARRYVDGNLISLGGITDQPISSLYDASSAAPFEIGGPSGYAGLDGFFDEVRIYEEAIF